MRAFLLYRIIKLMRLVYFKVLERLDLRIIKPNNHQQKRASCNQEARFILLNAVLIGLLVSLCRS